MAMSMTAVGALARRPALVASTRSYCSRKVAAKAAGAQASEPLYPRAAVGVVCRCSRTHKIALVQRGTPPNRGQWSLPGGRIELGEQTLAAASRELSEETGLDAVDFHPHAFMVSDVIALPDFHYLIAQMYCSTADAAVQQSLTPGDDAMSARWYSLHEMDELCGQGLTTGSVVAVVRRSGNLNDGLSPFLTVAPAADAARDPAAPLGRRVG